MHQSPVRTLPSVRDHRRIQKDPRGIHGGVKVLAGRGSSEEAAGLRHRLRAGTEGGDVFSGTLQSVHWYSEKKVLEQDDSPVE